LLVARLNPSKRAGKNSNAWRNANTAPRVMPTSLNGNEISQTSGNRSKARSAKGQQSTNRMDNPINKIWLYNKKAGFEPGLFDTFTLRTENLFSADAAKHH